MRQRCDPAALLRIYLSFRQLPAAAALVCGFIDAHFIASPHFAVTPVHMTARAGSVWLPNVEIETLIALLQRAMGDGGGAGPAGSAAPEAELLHAVIDKLGQIHNLVGFDCLSQN